VRRAFDVLLDTPLYDDVTSIYTKIAGSLPELERAELDSFGERFVYLPEGGTTIYKGKDDILDALQTGVLRRWRVAFTYRPPGGEPRQGVLEPYAMVLYKNGLYAIGPTVAEDGDGKAVRRPHVYACERFETAEFQRGAVFEVPRSFRGDRYFDGVFGIFMSEGERKHVVVEFGVEARPLVEARTWHKTQKITGLPGGGVRLEFDVVDLTQVQTWALGWGPHARVCGPPELVKRMKAELAEMRKLY
jgi:proteasome accessory factor B